ncbi:hypothetical protein MTR67_020271 [Solanum verrucosum]|uniref:Uncharacterized protein n=1 Tax=Solanum verrucosum TaxID=315347 RepID=A0AAF0TP06_SOLVR|nr:hypothetical protein MTR67_020271 [Solanum verrucosum]
MAMTFTPLSWLLWSGKHQEPKISNGSSLNSSPDSLLWESDTLKFPLDRRRDMASSSRKVKRKWQSREERKIDREYDIVIVPSDGGCVSGSESEDSDWSVGWLEPHGPGFNSDDDLDDSFAVLVPCYGYGCANVEENAQDKFLQAIANLKDIYATVYGALGLISEESLKSSSAYGADQNLFSAAYPDSMLQWIKLELLRIVSEDVTSACNASS